MMDGIFHLKSLVNVELMRSIWMLKKMFWSRSNYRLQLVTTINWSMETSLNWHLQWTTILRMQLLTLSLTQMISLKTLCRSIQNWMINIISTGCGNLKQTVNQSWSCSVRKFKRSGNHLAKYEPLSIDSETINQDLKYNCN